MLAVLLFVLLALNKNLDFKVDTVRQTDRQTDKRTHTHARPTLVACVTLGKIIVYQVKLSKDRKVHFAVG